MMRDLCSTNACADDKVGGVIWPGCFAPVQSGSDHLFEMKANVISFLSPSAPVMNSCLLPRVAEVVRSFMDCWRIRSDSDRTARR